MLPNHARRLLAPLLVAALLVFATGCSSSNDVGSGTSAKPANGKSASGKPTGGKSDNGKPDSGTNPPTASGQEPDLTVTAADLAAAFEADAADADAKYNGKVLKVTGIVEGLPLTDSADGIYLTFGAADEDGDLNEIGTFYLAPAEVAKAEKLWRGQEVTIVGKCIGAPIVGPTLMESRIEEIGEPIPVIEIAAGELFREYQEDEEAADGKYKDKVLVVSGVVANMDSDEQKVDIRGDEQSNDDAMRLQFRYGQINKALVAQLANLEAGDNIKIKGKCGGMDPFKNTLIHMYFVRIETE